MAVMLRTQGIPARVAVGYTPGEQVGNDRYVVRGLQSHMWVEMYVPDVGWIRFDPTPAGPRRQAEQERIDATTDGGSALNRSQRQTAANVTEETPGAQSETNETVVTAPPRNDSTGNGEGPAFDPGSPASVTLGVFALVGLVVGARRSGVFRRLRDALAVRYQSRSTPEADVVRAFDRLEVALTRRHRPRGADEPPRRYLDAIDADGRARRVVEVWERARYGPGVTREQAEEAIALVDAIVRDDTGSAGNGSHNG
jgi:hypothetical protein